MSKFRAIITLAVVMLITALTVTETMAQTILIGGNQYAFRYQNSTGATTSIGLFFSSSNNRYEFRDVDASWHVFINPIDDITSFRGVVGMGGITNPLATLHLNGTVRMGPGGDFLSIESDGSVLMNGNSALTVKNNKYVFKREGTSAGIYNNTGNNRIDYRDDVGNRVYSVFINGSNKGNTFTNGTGEFGDIEVNNDLQVTGTSSFAAANAADMEVANKLLLTNNVDVAGSSTIGQEGPLVIGNTGGNRISISKTVIQTMSSTASAPLRIQPFDGNTTIGDGGGNVTIAAGGGRADITPAGSTANISDFVHAIGSAKRLGVRDPDPEYTFQVKHETGAFANNGLAIENELVGSFWYMYVYTNGDLGMFTDTLKGLFDDVSGNYASTSDRRLKKNIRPLGSVTERLMQLEPKQYNYKHERGNERDYYGFIAQELKEVFPNVVTEAEESGINLVYHTELIPIAVAAIQEQQGVIESQQSEIEKLQEEVAKVSQENQELQDVLRRLDNLEEAMSQCCTSHDDRSGADLPASSEAQLGQNIPNPFSNSTLISYFLPTNASAASLRVVDMNGSLVKEFALQGNGFGQVEFALDGLASGNYLYTLYINGAKVDTKSMQVK